MYDDDYEICPDTGIAHIDCPCMWCHPPRFFFKYLVGEYDYKSISGVIAALKKKLAFFKKLRNDGFKLMAPIDDHLAEFEPPDSEDTYWVWCQSGGCYLEIKKGEVPPQQCPQCAKNVYIYEECEKRKRGVIEHRLTYKAHIYSYRCRDIDR